MGATVDAVLTRAETRIGATIDVVLDTAETGVVPETLVGATVDTVLTGVGGQTNGRALARRRVEVIPDGREFVVNLIEQDNQSTIGL